MRTLKYYKTLLIVAIFYDYTYDSRPRSILSSDLSLAKLIMRFLNIIIAFPFSLMAWALLRMISTRYKVSIYVLKPFRPGFASTYLNMIEPLCRQLQHENYPRHIKILVETGESVNENFVKSYEPNFTMYLDDRRKFSRLIAYLIPKSGLEKKILNTSNKFDKNWTLAPSTNYSNKFNQIPDDLKNLGVRPQNFVVFAHPSRKYYEQRMTQDEVDELSIRFLDLSFYKEALEKVAQQNLLIVRVGLDVDTLPNSLQSLKIIDCGGESERDYDHFWLYENCKFCISVSCGAFWLARKFNRPSIITDNYSQHDLFGYLSTLWTPRLVKNTNTGEILSFSKLLDANNLSALGSATKMKARQLSYVQNSSTTLVNAFEEMLALEDGVPKYSRDDLHLLNRYFKIYHSTNYTHLSGYVAPCISFLREFPFLLD